MSEYQHLVHTEAECQWLEWTGNCTVAEHYEWR